MNESRDTQSLSESGNRPLAVVTGANGFIGRHLCRTLQSAGFSVKALVRTQRDFADNELPADQVVAMGLTDSRLVDELRGAAVVFHLAAIAHTGVTDEQALQQINVEICRIITAACCEAGVPRLIHFSSVLALDPEQSAYARSKFDGELAIRATAGDALAVVILRPANVYGPGMQGNWMGLMRLIAARRMPPLPRLDNRLAMVSVQDLCQAALLFAQTDSIRAGQLQCHVVTDGQDYSPNDIESAIYRALGRNKPAWHSPRVLFLAAAALSELANKLGILRSGFGLGSYRNLVRDSSAGSYALNALQEAIAYQPSVTFPELLPELVDGIYARK